MSKDEAARRQTLSPIGRQRRLLLQRTAFAAAGVSVTSVLAAQEALVAPGAAKPVPLACPEVKIPMKEVSGKTAFVTGGSSGIGLGITQALTGAGMNVVIGYRTKEHLDEVLEQLRSAKDRIHAISVDVTDRPGLERAAAETMKVFGKVHVLVNNAGVYTMAPLSRATYGDWDWQMGVNLNGVFNGIHAFLPHIQAHGEGGQIVNTASAWGLIATTNAAIYSATKAGVIALSEALRGELAESNIGVSVYCPGGVNSRGGNSSRNRPAHLAETGSKPQPQSGVATKKAVTELPLMDATEAGQFVLRGIRNNDLYILSHPEYEQGIRDRYEALLASIPRDVQPPAERVKLERSTLRNTTYVTERDRRLCAQSASRKPGQQPRGTQ